MTREGNALEAMVAMLQARGDRFSGCPAEDAARDWDQHDFSVAAADEWCAIGVWDAATAAVCRDAGHTPDAIRAASRRLIEAVDEPADHYTDGDPIFAVCNDDLDIAVILDAVT